ncbi:MAG: hypothetical protein MUO26_05365 [Methanotrichaceae archaeon]|nr:hypothetical protein [Methanotrichaceae archaeon]
MQRMDPSPNYFLSKDLRGTGNTHIFTSNNCTPGLTTWTAGSQGDPSAALCPVRSPIS